MCIGGPKELSRNTAGLLKGSSPNYSTQADYDGGPKTNSTSSSGGTGSSTQNTRGTYNDNDSHQSLSGTKPSSSSSPTKFNNEDIYRRKYPELAPPIMNPTLTTANPYPGTSSGSPNPNPNPNPIRSEMSISESKVSTEIVGKSDLSRVQRVSDRNDFDDFVFLDSNNDAIKHKVLVLVSYVVVDGNLLNLYSTLFVCMYLSMNLCSDVYLSMYVLYVLMCIYVYV